MPRVDGETYFNNFEQTGYETLADWTPTFYTGIKESDALLRFAGKTIDDMAEQLEQFCRDMFIDTMDEEALSRMEDFYYMGDNSSRTLEERRRLLKSMQIGSGKISTERISRIVESYTGIIPEFEFIHKLIIRAYFDDDYALKPSDLPAILRRQIPAHIKYTIEFDIDVDIDAKNKEVIEIPSIQFKLPFPFWEFLALDGSWNLDGSYNLDGGRSYSPFFGFFVGYSITNALPEDSLWNTGFRLGFEVSEGVDVGLPTIPLFIYLEESITPRLGTLAPLQESNEVGQCTLEEINEGGWFLNGTYSLDGTRTLRTNYRKEIL